MIKASELRLGNLCWDIKSKELLQVADLSYNAPVGFTVVNRAKYPLPDGWQAEYIPLTPEWLEHCGYIRDSTDKKYYNSSTHLPPLGLVKTGEYCMEGLPLVCRNILYVHQLQNIIFALTGEELTIKDTISF